MANPVTVDIPHKLGRESARSRLDGSIGKLADMFPGGGNVMHHWEGDTMVFTATVRSSSLSRAFQTLPKPPTPMRSINSKRPSFESAGAIRVALP